MTDAHTKAKCFTCDGEKEKPGQVNIMNGRPSSSGLFFGKGSVIGQKDCTDPFHVSGSKDENRTQPFREPGLRDAAGRGSHDIWGTASPRADRLGKTAAKVHATMEPQLANGRAGTSFDSPNSVAENADSSCSGDGSVEFKPSPISPEAMEGAKGLLEYIDALASVRWPDDEWTKQIAGWLQKNVLDASTEKLQAELAQTVKYTGLLNDRMLEAEAENQRLREALQHLKDITLCDLSQEECSADFNNGFRAACKYHIAAEALQPEKADAVKIERPR